MSRRMVDVSVWFSTLAHVQKSMNDIRITASMRGAQAPYIDRVS